MAQSASRTDRRHTPRQKDNRSEAQRDRDRILYNSAFRRLAGVTQVVAAEEGDVFHNRLTHSIKVAQFGRRIAEKLIREADEGTLQALGGLDPDVVEASCLAHDIGHPPFGHVAERELDKLASDIGGFEGNAQSFRVVTKLGIHSPWDTERESSKYEGLDLTLATLNAVLKYPWKRGEGPKNTKKWGVYGSEEDDFRFARSLTTQQDKRRSLEAELMDWADDVTYSVHDMEDFYRAGLIPLDRLKIDDRSKKDFYDRTFARDDGEAARLVAEGRFTRTQLEEAFETILETMPVEEPYAATREQRCHLRNLTSGLIRMYIQSVSLQTSNTTDAPIRIEPERKCQVVMGKELTWHFVILNPSLGAQQQGHRTIIKGLHTIFSNEADERRFNSFPQSARESLETAKSDQEHLRIIVDLIAGMTEQQAIQMYQRLAGITLGSVLLNIVR